MRVTRVSLCYTYASACSSLPFQLPENKLCGYFCKCSEFTYSQQGRAEVHRCFINLGVKSIILTARIVSGSKLYAEDPQILETSLRNLVACTTWLPGFVQPRKGGLLHGCVKLHILHQQLHVKCVRIFRTAILFVRLLVWNRVVCAIYILSE
jgi:hypothetical protein